MTVTSYTYTGAPQTFTVPAGVTSVVLDAQGASGCPFFSANGGTGSHVRGTLAVTPGQVLQINVGGGGTPGNGVNPGVGGWNGGGNGGGVQTPGNAGSGGGGASDVRALGTALANRVIVGAGGGCGGNSGNGGGGGSLGGNGANAVGGDFGSGGTQSAGGAAGTFGVAGALGLGGQGCFNSGTSTNLGGGGGGAGYYGGGGGGNDAGTGSNSGGGGGGSSYAGGCTSTSTIAAGTTGGNSLVSANDGFVTVTTADTAPNAPTLTLPVTNGYADVNDVAVAWTFSDPDSGDTQSSADIRYRVAGTANWTTLSSVVTGTLSTYQITGLTVGVRYEWQVRTYDSQGTVGAYSSSSFFTAVLSATSTFTGPIAGQAITNLSTNKIFWAILRNQTGWVARRVADNNGQPDTTTIYETQSLGSTGASNTSFSNATIHNDGPEHWQIQFNTFNGTVVSQWYDFYVIMSLDAPPTPTCAVTSTPASGSNQIVGQLADFAVDYYADSTVPTVANTGQALTTTGAPAMNGGGTLGNNVLFASTAAFGQTATLASKILSMSCTFLLNTLGSTHANSITLVARDASNNAHIYCTATRTGWSINIDVTGTITSLASGTYTALPTTNMPYTISAAIIGNILTFTDPYGNTHAFTDTRFGTFTGTIAQIIADNSNVTTPDKYMIAHWSANFETANPVTAYVARSVDGVTFAPIPAAQWDTNEYGAIFTYTDYTPPFNRRVWYQVVSTTAAGAIAKSAVS